MVGSVVALTYMPIITSLTRSDPLKVSLKLRFTYYPESYIYSCIMQCEAISFLAGSLGDLSLTLWFIPIL